MNNRNRLLLGAGIAAPLIGVPAAPALAECPPADNGSIEIVITIEEIPPGPMVLPGGGHNVDPPVPTPGVFPIDQRDPANSMINMLGLVIEGSKSRIEALAGSKEQFQQFVGDRALRGLRRPEL